LVLVALYQAAFFAWRTATPGTADEIRNDRLAFYFWFGTAAIAFIGGIAMIFWAFWRQRTPVSPGGIRERT
jgi:hypothetical protein